MEFESKLKEVVEGTNFIIRKRGSMDYTIAMTKLFESLFNAEDIAFWDSPHYSHSQFRITKPKFEPVTPGGRRCGPIEIILSYKPNQIESPIERLHLRFEGTAFDQHILEFKGEGGEEDLKVYFKVDFISLSPEGLGRGSLTDFFEKAGYVDLDRHLEQSYI